MVLSSRARSAKLACTGTCSKYSRYLEYLGRYYQVLAVDASLDAFLLFGLVSTGKVRTSRTYRAVTNDRVRTGGPRVVLLIKVSFS